MSLDSFQLRVLCALLSRAELRDLVDIYSLAQRGFSTEQAVDEASRKDGGMSPGQLAWLLSEIELGDDAQPPAVSRLRNFGRSCGSSRKRCRGLPFRSRKAWPLIPTGRCGWLRIRCYGRTTCPASACRQSAPRHWVYRKLGCAIADYTLCRT